MAITPTFDKDGYPSEESLERIRQWRVTEGFDALFAFVQELWRYNTLTDTTRPTLVTGGWSGNEEIIAALKQNMVFWHMCWYSSVRGGRHEFILPERGGDAFEE